MTRSTGGLTRRCLLHLVADRKLIAFYPQILKSFCLVLPRTLILSASAMHITCIRTVMLMSTVIGSWYHKMELICRWDLIAGRIPGRKAEEIERFWIMKHREGSAGNGKLYNEVKSKTSS
uniref:Uncharacterized protein n=1 Tax=Populus davidiana TaxID=266767 RepID=A0A6M2ETC0_9ROSI